MSVARPEPLPRPVNVLVLHRGGAHIRGSEQVLLDLLQALRGAEFRPIVLCSNPAFADVLRPMAVEADVIAFPEIMVNPGEFRAPLLSFVRALFRLRRFCVTRDVGMVFCNGGGPCQLGVPVAASLGIPLICLFHHPAWRWYELNWLLPLVRTFVFPSHYTASHIEKSIGRRGEVVHLPVDTAVFRPAPTRRPELRSSLNIGPDEVVFAQVGALVPYKQHDHLIRAFAAARPRMPPARLLIIGTGPRTAALESLIRELDVSDVVILTGRVPDVVPFLQHVVDVHVLASREEGLGLVNLQASACELPNIANAATGIPETIIHESTGLLVPDRDEAALADAMVRLAADPELRRTLGRNGRQFVLRQHSPQGFGRGMLRIMRAVAGRKRSSRKAAGAV